MAGEVFRMIEDCPGYSVSNLGRVRSDRSEVRGKCSMRRHSPRILRQHGSGKRLQYLFVCLSVNGLRRTRKVAHLVAQAFLGERPRDHDVDHIDGDTRNNAASNLRYLHKSVNRGLRHAGGR